MVWRSILIVLVLSSVTLGADSAPVTSYLDGLRLPPGRPPRPKPSEPDAKRGDSGPFRLASQESDVASMARTWRDAIDRYRNREAAAIEPQLIQGLLRLGSTNKETSTQVDGWRYWARDTTVGYYEVGSSPATVESEDEVSSARPTLYQLTDAWGQRWTHADPAYLQAWVAQRNASAIRWTYPGGTVCGPGGCPPRR